MHITQQISKPIGYELSSHQYIKTKDDEGLYTSACSCGWTTTSYQFHWEKNAMSKWLHHVQQLDPVANEPKDCKYKFIVYEK